MPGLLPSERSRQIVFLRTDPKHIASKTYLQGSYRPDIVLLRWDFSKTYFEYPKAPYPESHESGLRCESGFKKPHLSCKDVLSTLDPEYAGDFGELRGDCQVMELSKSSRSPPPEMAGEEYWTRSGAFTIVAYPFFCSHQVQFHQALARESHLSAVANPPVPVLQRRSRDTIHSGHPQKGSKAVVA